MADDGHFQWVVFTVPEPLRSYFMHYRERPYPLSAAGWRNLRDLMVVASGEEQGFRPAMVAVAQPFADELSLHPRVHAVATPGSWTSSGQWVPVPSADASAVEKAFRHKIIFCLQRAGVLDEARTRLLFF